MKKIIILILLSIFSLLPFSSLIPSVNAQVNQSKLVNPAQDYYKAKVIKIIENSTTEIQNTKTFKQIVEVKFLEGPLENKTVKIENTGSIKIIKQKNLEKGDKVIVLVSTQNGKSIYTVWDKYRLNYIYFLIIGFFALILIFAGLKGLGSIIGMIVSFIVIIGFIVPQIINGKDPVLISILGSIVILMTTIFLAHGISKRTTSAVASTVIALTITGVLAFIFVKLFNLTGFGDENSYFLQIGNLNINPQGLLLGGIIIGTLGVLDDVTTTQSAAIFELFKMDKKLSITDLFTKGYTIGREHIASLVNTLILAYAGASLGLFVIFVLNPNNMPTWVMLNDEMITEEIVRAIVGSIGLILAVPITTIIASYVAKRTTL